MSDWQALRDYLRDAIGEQIDHAIRNDPDLEMRGLLARHRARIVELACDQVELVHLRQALAAREQEDPVPVVVKPNGKAPARLQ